MKFVTFGEVMLRLSPPGHYRLLQSSSLNMTLAGAEANVAADLACLGEQASFVTRFPVSPLSQIAVNELRKYGVDTSDIMYGGDRIGLIFVEKGASQRPSNVIYDRKYSAISQCRQDEPDWDKIFDGAGWFHLSGITPALGGELPAICLDACRKAKEKGVTVSLDLNYRSKLWSREQACKVMTELCRYVDVCIANEEDVKDVFGIVPEGSDIEGGKLSVDGYRKTAEQLFSRFGFSKVAFTLRESINADINDWSAVLCTKDNAFVSKKYRINIVDRVGGGDSFAAGLIYSLANGKNNSDSIEFATAMSCLKHTVEGDFALVTVEEVNALVAGSGSGRVKR